MNAFVDLTVPFAVVVLLGGVLLYWMPRLTRPDLYFAITVSSDFRDSAEGREILARYHRRVLLASLIALGLLGLGAFKALLGLLVAALLVQEGGWLQAYLSARSQVRPHAVPPTPVREALLSPRRAHLPGGWLAQMGPFAALGALALYLRHRWADIPPRFPIHWGLDGLPNGWSTRTPAGVYGPLLAGAAVCLMLAALAYGIVRWSRPIRLGGRPGQAEERYRRTVAGIVVATEYLLVAMFAWTSLLPLSHAGTSPPSVWGVLAITLLFVVLVVALIARKGQGGARAAAPSAGSVGETRPVGDRTEDRYWKAGFLYINPEDPAVLVEKRFGLGYTLNFGRPVAWMMLAALVLVPLAITLVVKWAGK